MSPTSQTHWHTQLIGIERLDSMIGMRRATGYGIGVTVMITDQRWDRDFRWAEKVFGSVISMGFLLGEPAASWFFCGWMELGVNDVDV